MRSQSNGLSNRSTASVCQQTSRRKSRLPGSHVRESVSKRHEPGLPLLLGPVDHGNTGSEGESLKHFYAKPISAVGLRQLGNARVQLTVKNDGYEQDDERIADGNAQGHSDEDAMEEDTHFQHHALEPLLSALLLL